MKLTPPAARPLEFAPPGTRLSVRLQTLGRFLARGIGPQAGLASASAALRCFNFFTDRLRCASCGLLQRGRRCAARRGSRPKPASSCGARACGVRCCTRRWTYNWFFRSFAETYALLRTSASQFVAHCCCKLHSGRGLHCGCGRRNGNRNCRNGHRSCCGFRSVRHRGSYKSHIHVVCRGCGRCGVGCGCAAWCRGRGHGAAWRSAARHRPRDSVVG